MTGEAFMKIRWNDLSDRVAHILESDLYPKLNGWFTLSIMGCQPDYWIGPVIL